MCRSCFIGLCGGGVGALTIESDVAELIACSSRRQICCLPCPLFLTLHSFYLHTHHTYETHTGMGVSRRAWRPHFVPFLLSLCLLSTSTDGFGPLQPQRLSPLRVPLNAAAPDHSKHARTAKATSRKRAFSSSWALQVRLPCLWCFLQPSLPPSTLAD